MAEANIVQDFFIGHTRIKIADNYCCNKTQRDIDEILTRIAQKVQKHINAAATAGIYEQKDESKGTAAESVCCSDGGGCIGDPYSTSSQLFGQQC